MSDSIDTDPVDLFFSNVCLVMSRIWTLGYKRAFGVYLILNDEHRCLVKLAVTQNCVIASPVVQ